MRKILEYSNELISSSEFSSLSDVKNELFERYKALKEILKREIVPKHLQNLSETDAFFKIISNETIYYTLIFGLKEALQTSNFKLLNDTIFSYNRLEYRMKSVLDSGTDHSINFIKSIETFAANDIDLILEMFPIEKELCSKGHIFNVVGSNLIVSLLYKNEDWIKSSIKKADELLSKKQPIFDKNIIKYLISINGQNSEEISENVKNICQTYSKSKWIHSFRNPIFKKFGLFIHGLYNFAYQILDSNIFEKILIPKSDFILDDFIEFQKTNKYIKGKNYLNFEEELSFLNQIF